MRLAGLQWEVTLQADPKPALRAQGGHQEPEPLSFSPYTPNHTLNTSFLFDLTGHFKMSRDNCWQHHRLSSSLKSLSPTLPLTLLFVASSCVGLISVIRQRSALSKINKARHYLKW